MSCSRRGWRGKRGVKWRRDGAGKRERNVHRAACSVAECRMMNVECRTGGWVGWWSGHRETGKPGHRVRAFCEWRSPWVTRTRKANRHGIGGRGIVRSRILCTMNSAIVIVRGRYCPRPTLPVLLTLDALRCTMHDARCTMHDAPCTLHSPPSERRVQTHANPAIHLDSSSRPDRRIDSLAIEWPDHDHGDHRDGALVASDL